MFRTFSDDIARAEAVKDLMCDVMLQMPSDANNVKFDVNWEVKKVDNHDVLVPIVSLSYTLGEEDAEKQVSA